MAIRALPFPAPLDEAERLAVLARYRGLEDVPRGTLDRIARTAAHALRAPLGIVSVVDREVVWARGIGGREKPPVLLRVPRHLSFCTHGVAVRAPLRVEDAARDVRFLENPLVTETPGIRAYAGAPILTPEGHALGMVCVVDTTPRVFADEEVEVLESLAEAVADALVARHAARALERAATEYRALFRAHPQPMLVFDTETLRILAVNDAALDAYGYTREELLGRTLRDLGLPEEAPRPEARRADFEEGRLASGPWIHRRKDGSLLHVDVEATPITLHGRPARLVRLTDASERMRLRDELGRTRALTETAFAALDDVLFVADPTGRLLRANPKAEDVTGVASEELRARTIDDFFAAEELPRVREAFGRVLEHGRARLQAGLRMADGTYAPYEFVGAALYDADGRVTGAVGIGRDVREAVRLERLRTGKLEALKTLAQGAPIGLVLERAACLAEEVVPGARCLVFVHDPREGRLRPATTSRTPAPDGALVELLREIAEAQEGDEWGLHVREGASCDRFREAAERLGVQACWVLPLRSPEGQRVGALSLCFEDGREPAPELLSLLEPVRNLVVIAIEHERREEALRQRDRMLRAAADAMFALLAEPDLERGVVEALRTLGEAADADRAYLFEHTTCPETGDLLANQRAEWVRAGVTPQIDNPDLQGIRVADLLPQWAEALATAGVVEGSTETFEGRARAVLQAQDIRSFLLVPVYVRGEPWGFVGFDDCRRGRRWTEAERAMLRVAGAALGAACTRARDEAALRTAHARFEALTANAPGVVYECVVHPDGGLSFPYISQGGKAAFGCDLTVLMREPERLREIIHPDDWHSLRDSIKEAVDERKPWAWAGRILNDAAEVRWAAGTSRLVAEEPDGSTHWYGLFLDVSAQREAEVARRASEARYRSLFEAVDEGFCLVDLLYGADGEPVDVRFVEANPAFARHTGLDEVVGRCGSELLSGLDRGWLDVLDHAHRSGGPVRVERRYLPTGRWFAMEARPVPDPEGHARLAVLLADVTDRKAYEQELIAAREAAEAGRRAAEEVARVKGVLLANMSHELRTPLTGIIGFSDLLLMELEGDQREMVELIAQSGRRLLDTLSSILDLAELESGTYNLAAMPIEPACTLQPVLARAAEAAARKGLAFDADVPEGVVVLGDAQALRRVLHHLLDNAVKFTETGRVALTVRREAGRVLFQVTDTGVGIPEAFRPHLFREFRQASEGVRRDYEGSGLGLAIAYRLVQAMGGTLDLESAVGEGSTFTVRLPAPAT